MTQPWQTCAIRPPRPALPCPALPASRRPSSQVSRDRGTRMTQEPCHHAGGALCLGSGSSDAGTVLRAPASGSQLYLSSLCLEALGCVPACLGVRAGRAPPAPPDFALGINEQISKWLVEEQGGELRRTGRDFPRIFGFEIGRRRQISPGLSRDRRSGQCGHSWAVQGFRTWPGGVWM